MKYPRITDLCHGPYGWRVTLEYSVGNSQLLYGFTKHATLRAAVLECRHFIAIEVAKKLLST